MDDTVQIQPPSASTNASRTDNALWASIEDLFFADYGEIAQFYRQLEMRNMQNPLFLPRTLTYVTALLLGMRSTCE